MSGGKNPLMLMMALSMPGAAHALGLGDIHVDSALNERLSAEIDIVGATALELNDLRAALASRETFLRHGADRPAFLASTTFKVTEDAQGRPVLAVRSTESFTEPVVSLLVDLHWRTGELVREYTLLLDPAGVSQPSPAPVAAAMPVVAEPIAAPVAAALPIVAAPVAPEASATTRKTTHIKVGAKATLRGIAWRVGERSEPDLQRMMIALFRANPAAFDGNINRLHRGAVLTIPTRADVAAISKTEANREFRAQMAAWRSGGAARMTAANASPVASAPPTAGTSPVASAEPKSNAQTIATAQPDTEALTHRIQSLEQELRDLKGMMDSERTQLAGIQAQADRMQNPAPAAAQAPPVAQAPAVAPAPVAAQVPATAQPQAISPRPEKVEPRSSALVPVLGGLGTLAAALAALYFRYRRRPAVVARPAEAAPAPVHAPLDTPVGAVVDAHADTPVLQAEIAESVPAAGSMATAAEAPPAAPVPVAVPAATVEGDYTVISAGPPVGIDATHPMLPAIAAGRSEIATGTFSTAQLDPTVNLRLDPLRLDFNLLDLDLTSQHVQMPSMLNEHAVVKERRTNLADVLKVAIEREPDRHDLRLKLLELYYTAAASNRKAFLDVVQLLSQAREHLNPEQWEKITKMGRQIASDDPLFTEESPAGGKLADCA
jgi:pilus assembly protein FimV